MMAESAHVRACMQVVEHKRRCSEEELKAVVARVVAAEAEVRTHAMPTCHANMSSAWRRGPNA